MVEALFKKNLHWDLKLKIEILLILYPGLTFTPRQFLRALHGLDVGDFLANITICLEEERQSKIDVLLEWYLAALSNPQNSIFPKNIIILGRPETIPTEFARQTGQLHCDAAKHYKYSYNTGQNTMRQIEFVKGADIKSNLTAKHANNKSIIMAGVLDEEGRE